MQILFCSLILMGEELRLHVQLVGDTWVMFLKGRGSRYQQMNATMSTVFQSSLFLLIQLLLYDSTRKKLFQCTILTDK